MPPYCEEHELNWVEYKDGMDCTGCRLHRNLMKLEDYRRALRKVQVQAKAMKQEIDRLRAEHKKEVQKLASL
jgi:Zn-finger protein